MIEKVHDQLILELKLNERTNTIFVLTSILLNLVILAVNASISGVNNSSKYIIMILFSLLMVGYCVIAVAGILHGRKIRFSLIDGLMNMYRDNGVDQYYNTALLEDYSYRYSLLIVTIITTGIVSLAVPFLTAILF